MKATRFGILGIFVLGMGWGWLMVLQPVRASLDETAAVTPPPPTICPEATPELFLVEPVTSPTDLLVQTISVYIGNGDAITITAESGVFAGTTITLLPNTVHHLYVQAHVQPVNNGGCQYGDYTLGTSFDRFGNPLIIVQGNGSATPPPTFTPTTTSTPHPDAYLPVILKSGDLFSPTTTPTVTWSPTATNPPSCLNDITATISPPFSTNLLNTPIPTCTPTPTASPTITSLPSTTPNCANTNLLLNPPLNITPPGHTIPDCTTTPSPVTATISPP